MTKLRRKLQQLAKKRAHKKTVQKRKSDRAAKELVAKKEADAKRLEELVERDMLRLSNSGNPTREQDYDEVAANGTNFTNSQRQLVGGLVMNSLAVKSGKKKQLTRKQMRRKEKNVEKGEAIAEQMEKKWISKKIRVKVRAQTRNAELHN